MSDERFLVHVIDPFGMVEPALVLAKRDGTHEVVTLGQLVDLDEAIITYEVSVLVNALRARSCGLPKYMVEVKDALKLASGLSKDQGGERKWNVFGRLASVEPGAYARALAEMARGQRLQPERGQLLDMLSIAVFALITLWDGVLTALAQTGERERFMDIEVPVQQIFWFRQYHGIALNQTAWHETRERAQNEKYIAYRQVAAMIGTSPSTVNYQNVGAHLEGTDAEFLSEFAASQSIESCFRLASEFSTFAKAFVAFSQARKDESIILRINPMHERMLPSFECFGTVTGRIIALNPALQSLSRRHRHFLAADEGNSLLYLDYAQFEPGVLAQLSGDRSLIDAYNVHDLYVELSRVLFGTSSKRDEAKRIFLAYSYGMSPHSIGRLLNRQSNGGDETGFHALRVAQFFSNYPGLDKLRGDLLSELQDRGSISSLMGNHRSRVGVGRLNGKEQNWALSQRIQGTASLIFKDALNEIANIYGPGSVLLPMHDAVLLQVPNDDLSSRRVEISTIMAVSFKKWLPDVNARINSQAFAIGPQSLVE